MNSPFIHSTMMLPLQENAQMKTKAPTPAEAQADFKKVLSDALGQVNKAQSHSNEMTQKMVTGEVNNLHDVMISAEKASVLLQTTIEVRNKAIEGYKEVMRMQV